MVWTVLLNQSVGTGLYELKNSSGELLKKKANIARLKALVQRKHTGKDDPTSTAHLETDCSTIETKERSIKIEFTYVKVMTMNITRDTYTQ